MGIENERKLLLNVNHSQELWRSLKQHASELGIQFMDITQGYLSGSARVRHVVPHDPEPGSAREHHIFTYKVKVMGSTVELEHELDPHDYHKLMLITKPVILKTRAKICQGDLTWDIDFFKMPKSGAVYFLMAEVEMPEFQTELPTMLDVLSPYMIRWVDAGDKRFNNKSLSNPKKAIKHLQDMGIKHEAKAATK
jgi:CYTH domain-containing protein